MPQPNEAWPILWDTVKHDRTHPFYDDVVEYANLCTALISGEGCKDLLQQIVTRETGEQFQLRGKLFYPLPPSICAKARVPFTQVTRVDGTITETSWEGETGPDNPKKKKLTDAFDKFYGERSFEDYLNERFLDLNRTDPNAFVVVEFEPFDPVSDRAKPYPLEIFSDQAINYGKTFDRVDWLIAKFPHTYTDTQGNSVEGKRFVMYFGWVFDMRQIEHDEKLPEIAVMPDGKSNPPAKFRINTESYELITNAPFSNRQKPEFQGLQVGHKHHPDVKKPWYVSSIHPGINRMLSTLKAGSEEGLVWALLAHPRLFMFLPKCEGDAENDDSCIDGKSRKTGKNCAVCNGAGRRLPSGVLDAMTFPLPDSKEEVAVALKDMVHHHSPDVAIIQALSEHLRKIEEEALHDIFTSTTHERGKVTATATEIGVDAEARNNAVLPYARKYSHAFGKLGRITAAFVDADKGLTIRKSIPEDLGMESLQQMLANLQVAKPVGSPDIVGHLDERIMVKMLTNRPLELKKYHVRKRFRPLTSVSEDMRASAIASGDVTLYDKTLLLQENEIYAAMDTIPNFYYLEESEQAKLIRAKVEEIMDRIKEEKANDIDFQSEMNDAQGLNPDGTPKEEAPAIAA